MKSLFTIIALFCMTSAFAASSTNLVNGDKNLSQATGEIVSVKPFCPSIPGQMRCMAYGSNITIQVSLAGCVDRLGGYFTKFEVVDGKGTLYFSAINIANVKSETARCVSIPFETITVGVPFEGDIELVNLDFATKK